MREPKTAHVRILKSGVGEGTPGTKLWMAPTRARVLMEAGSAELVNADVPRETSGILRRSGDPLNRFSTVVRAWEGSTVVLIGGGPSLTLEQVALVKAAHDAGKVRAIAINDAYLWAPWADVLYAADSSWWLAHAKGVPKPLLRLSASEVRERFAAFQGERCSIQNSGANIEDARVHILRNKTFPVHGDGLSLDPGMLVTGRNSGYQALNLSVLAGATTDILIGFDGQVDKNGRTHWSGGHTSPTPEAAYAEYRKSFSAGEKAIKAAGVTVWNCSPGSAIDTFPKMALADALMVEENRRAETAL